MKKFYFLAALLLFSFFFVPHVFALGTTGSSGTTGIQVVSWDKCVSVSDKDVATLACIPIILQNIINFLALFAGVVAVFLLMLAGFKFITSEGDPQKVANARRTMIFVLWGAIIVVASLAIVGLISRFTGVSSIAPQ